MTPRVLVVGAGWTGAVTARNLTEAGLSVEVAERGPTVGGHSRFETLNGVVYEPHGPHIFHTSNPEVAGYVRLFGVSRPYEFRPLTEVDLGDDGTRLLSWPLQVEELETLPDWPRIRAELADLPPAPTGDDFETYVSSMMGRRLYELFIEGYTRKQWDRDPSTLSSSFAPRRVELRRDGYRRLFRDRWEFFPSDGMNSVIEAVLAPVAVTCGWDVTVDDDLTGYDAVVVTAALDDFLRRPFSGLEWRGVSVRARYVPTEPEQTVTAAYVINRPSPRVPYTRTVETKHATGQHVAGTVVAEEHPGAPERHYPIPTVDGRFEEVNRRLQAEVVERLAPTRVFFAGRLATYRYINQDQAIEQAFEVADEVERALC